MEDKWKNVRCIPSDTGNILVDNGKPVYDAKTSRDIAQFRICVEKTLPQHEHIHRHLRAVSKSEEHHQRLRAAFFKTKLWNPTTDRIVISFEEAPDNVRWTPPEMIAQKLRMNGQPDKLDPLTPVVMGMDKLEGVKKIVRERIMPIAGLNIRIAEDGERGNVRVGFNPNDGSHSLVGTDHKYSNSPTTINFGWLDVGTIIHEFCHMLGMIHEHQNPKGSNINWNKPAVYRWACSNQGWNPDITYNNIIYKMSIDQLNATQFDPKSIMLYAYPATLTLDHKATQFNARLSPTDVEFIHKMYPDSELTPKQFFEKYYSDSTYKPHDDWLGDGPASVSVTTWLIAIIIVILVVAIVVSVL